MHSRIGQVTDQHVHSSMCDFFSAPQNRKQIISAIFGIIFVNIYFINDVK